MADELRVVRSFRAVPPEVLGAIYWEQGDRNWSVRWYARGKVHRDTVVSLPMLGLGIARLVIGSDVPDVLVCEQPFSSPTHTETSIKVSRSAGLLEGGIVLGVDSWRARPPAAVYATAVQWRPAVGIHPKTERAEAKSFALSFSQRLMPSLKPILSALGGYDDIAEAALLSYLGATLWHPGLTQDTWLEALSFSFSRRKRATPANTRKRGKK